MCVLYVYILCFIYHLLSTISRFNRISGVYADCDIYLHTGENCTKKRYSPPQPSSLWLIFQRGIQSTVHIVSSSLSDVVTHFWLLLHGCVCVCENLWKLYYANGYLIFFFLEKITSINENIFSFFYKRWVSCSFSFCTGS